MTKRILDTAVISITVETSLHKPLQLVNLIVNCCAMTKAILATARMHRVD